MNLLVDCIINQSKGFSTPKVVFAGWSARVGLPRARVEKTAAVDHRTKAGPPVKLRVANAKKKSLGSRTRISALGERWHVAVKPKTASFHVSSAK